jgi:selenocysteine-specific elongation factor
MIIGTAGHIDHGKTTLIKALTGIDTDRLKEEKERGISIDLGYAYSPIKSGEILGFIDVPGHERFIHNMLAGVTGIDYVLLVVAADDGPMPQTVEHLQIIDLLNLSQGAVVITKTDRVSGERIAEVRREIIALLDASRLKGCPVFQVSSLSGAGIAELKSHLEGVVAKIQQRKAEGYFRLAVDRSFSLTGIGVVVTGTVHAGAVKVGDVLVISPSGEKLKIRGIHAQNRAAQMGAAGERCALNLSGAHIRKEDIRRGNWLLDEAIFSPVERFDALLQVLPTHDRALKHWTPVHVHLGCTDTTGRIATLEQDEIKAGQNGLVQVLLSKPTSVFHGDRFIIRNQSATRTLGGGTVLDPFASNRKRRSTQRLHYLGCMQKHNVPAALECLQQESSVMDMARLARTWNLPPQQVQNLCEKLGLVLVNDTDKLLGIKKQHWLKLKEDALMALKDFHARQTDQPGVAADQLYKLAKPDIPETAFQEILNQLAAEKRIARTNNWLHLKDHRVSLEKTDDVLWVRIKPLLQEAPYQPPRVCDIAKPLGLKEEEVRALLKKLAHANIVYQVAHDHFFLRESVMELIAIVKRLANEAKEGNITAAQLRDAVSGGRKAAVEILEFFDKKGLTMRVGDTHKIKAASLSSFK